MCLCALAWCKIPRIVWASSINTIRASGIPQIDIPAKEAILRNTPYELGDTASDHHHKHHTPRHPAARRRRVGDVWEGDDPQRVIMGPLRGITDTDATSMGERHGRTSTTL